VDQRCAVGRSVGRARSVARAAGCRHLGWALPHWWYCSFSVGLPPLPPASRRTPVLLLLHSRAHRHTRARQQLSTRGSSARLHRPHRQTARRKRHTPGAPTTLGASPPPRTPGIARYTSSSAFCAARRAPGTKSTYGNEEHWAFQRYIDKRRLHRCPPDPSTRSPHIGARRRLEPGRARGSCVARAADVPSCATGAPRRGRG
jgi:hypothetical protein